MSHLFQDGLPHHLNPSQQSHGSIESVPMMEAQTTLQYLERLLSGKYQISENAQKRVELVMKYVRQLDKIDRDKEEENARKIIQERDALEARRLERQRKKDEQDEKKPKADAELAEADRQAKLKKDAEELKARKEKEAAEAAEHEKKKQEEAAEMLKEEERLRVEAENKRKEERRLEAERQKAERERKLQEQRDELRREDEKYRKMLSPLNEKALSFFDEEDDIEVRMRTILAADVNTYKGVEAVKKELNVHYDTDKDLFLKLKKEMEDKLDQIAKGDSAENTQKSVVFLRKRLLLKLKEIFSKDRRFEKPQHMIGKRNLSALSADDDLEFF